MEYAHQVLPEYVCSWLEHFADSWLEGDAGLLIILIVTVIPTIILLWSLQREVLRRYGYVRYALDRAEFEPQKKKSKSHKSNNSNINNTDNNNEQEWSSSSSSSSDSDGDNNTNETMQDLNEVIAASEELASESDRHNYNYNSNRGDEDNVQDGKIDYINGYANHDEWSKKMS